MYSPSFSLAGKVAVVTGSGRGIGKAIALGFAEAGADVVVASRTTIEIEATANLIREQARRSIAVPTDVQDIEQVKNLLNRTLREFGRVDVLVNNAGGTVFRRTLETDLAFWDSTIRENLTSVYICCRIFGEAMVKQGAGNIINTSSIAGTGPVPRIAAYGAAKAGVISLTRTLAVEWAEHNIRVNSISPGVVLTPLTTQLSPLNTPYRQAQIKRIALGRHGKPEDMVGAAIFLASEASGYITGETIMVTGGLTTTAFEYFD